MIKGVFVVSLAIFLNIAFVSVYADDSIGIKSRTFIPKEGISDDSKVKIKSASSETHVILQLNYIPTSKQKKELELKGIKLLSYLPHRAWFVSVSPNTIDSILELPDVRSISLVRPEDKIEFSILSQGVNNFSLSDGKGARLIIVFFEDVSLEEISNIIEYFGGEIIDSIPIVNTLEVYLPLESIFELAKEDKVKWIGQHYESGATNDGARADVNVDTVQASPYNLKGKNVILGEWDTGCVDNTHDDYLGRITLGPCGSTNSHATHVAGIAIGDGNRSQANGGTSLQWKGMAPEARIVSYKDTGNIGYFSNNYTEAIKVYNISISTNSWGFSFWDGEYEIYNQLQDSIIRGSRGKRISIVWSVGNEGEVFGYGSIRSPAAGKNLIAVGNKNSNEDTLSSTSGKGPTADGRTKPDLVAPGCQISGDGGITSTASTDTYDIFCGTSMAAPVVSGSIALILENWHKYESQDPLPSTIKAVLIQTARDLGNVGPDYSFGYGNINITRAVDFFNSDNISQSVILEDSIDDQGDSNSFNLTIPSGQTELKITLVWDDYQADVFANPAIVNDLDLIVRAPNGSQYHPWILDPDNPSDSAKRNQSDKINNAEQVYVNSSEHGPLNGTWLVQVNGSAVPEPDQTYSLVSNVPFPSPILSIITIYPASPINVTKNTFFNFTVNVSCMQANCGEINVSLDPISLDLPIQIDSIPKQWKITTVEEDLDLYVEIKQFDERTFEFTPRPFDEESLSDDYSWSVALCNVEGVDSLQYFVSTQGKNFDNMSLAEVPLSKHLSDFSLPNKWCDITNEEGFLILNNAGKAELNHPIKIMIPKGAEKFRLHIGSGTVTIDLSAPSDATQPVNAEKLCRTSNGVLHLAYEGSSSDLWYANSSNNGATWGTKLLVSGTIQYAGIVCAPNDNITIYYVETVGDDIDAVTSTDKGASFGSPYTLMDISNLFVQAACAVNKVGTIHCCAIDDTADALYYVNSTQWDSEVAVNTNATDDSDICDIAVDSRNCPYLAAIGSGGDDLDIWSTPACGGSGWGDTNRIQIYDGATFSNIGTNIDLEIRNIEYADTLSAIGIDVGDLQFCTAKTSDLTSWTCQELDSGASANANLAIRSDGSAEILYSDSASAVSTAQIFRANSSDMVHFSVRQTLHTGGANMPSILDSHYSNFSNLNTSVRYVFTEETGDLFFNSYNITAAPREQKPGLVSIVTDSYPFYTISGNPITVILDEGESILLTYQINATGHLEVPFEFFAFVNKTSEMRINDETSKVNITIVS